MKRTKTETRSQQFIADLTTSLMMPKSVRITLKGKDVIENIEDVTSPKTTWRNFLRGNNVKVDPKTVHIYTAKGRSALNKPIWETLKKYKRRNSMSARLLEGPLEEVNNASRPRCVSEPRSITRQAKRDSTKPATASSPAKAHKLNKTQPKKSLPVVQDKTTKKTIPITSIRPKPISNRYRNLWATSITPNPVRVELGSSEELSLFLRY